MNQEDSVYYLQELLNSINPCWRPPHILKLKAGTPNMAGTSNYLGKAGIFNDK